MTTTYDVHVHCIYCHVSSHMSTSQLSNYVKYACVCCVMQQSTCGLLAEEEEMEDERNTGLKIPYNLSPRCL